MKNPIRATAKVILYVTSAAFALLALAGQPLEAQQRLVGGYLSSDFRLAVGNDFDFPNSSFSRGELLFDLYAEMNPNEQVHIFLDGWLLAAWSFPEGFTDVDFSVHNPFDYEGLLPVDIVLREAYVDLYGFPHRNMDLRAGRQRIPWGTAEKISAIDNLNPSDLEDFWDFGRCLPSEALKLTWYTRLFILQCVYLPLFRPAVLPEGISEKLQSAIPDLSPLVLSNLVMSYSLPVADPWQNATLGTRLSFSLFGWDLALSYIFGRQDFPAATTIFGTSTGGLPYVELEVENSYPRRHIAGLDVVGELFGLGVWAEGAAFFPDYTVVTDLTAVSGGSLSEEDAEHYVKACFGLDYTFPFGLYFNVQYAHGLAFENSREELQDYLLAAVEWELLNGRLKLGPLAVALEVDDPSDFGGTWGVVINPELSFKPFDAAEISAGLRWIEGQDGTTFGLSKEENELYLKGKFSF